MSVKTLVDKAAKEAGGRSKLSRAMDVTRAQITDWASGEKSCSPADRARLAAFAHEDAVQELVRATLESAKGEVRREQLFKVLGKSLPQTGAALVSVLPSLASLSYGISYFIRCILC